MAVLPAAVALGYASLHLNWYLETPLGQVPVLDERENLAFAESIFQGALPREPFYRAPGYALLLAFFRAVGVSARGLFPAALLLGVVLHALNAGLASLVANRWFGRGAALAAGLLYALHPVFVHYATQALDATLALTFFLAGLVFFAAPKPRGLPRLFSWALVSASWAAAALVRPNYLLVWTTLPLLAWWNHEDGRRWPRLAAASTGAVLFGVIAGWQWKVSGVAGFLPWQGAYNLWAANQPGAHGRFYTQRLSLPPELASENPARVESLFFYQQETKLPPNDIGAMNVYWRSRFLGYVSHHPLAWLAQLGRKAYALFNDWEQYNNKTFAFHKARSPWLRWNPLSWGVLFTLGVFGAIRLGVEAPQSARALLLIGSACVASILLFFVSARFRLPLAAIAVVLAGGALSAPFFWRGWSRARQLSLAVAGVLAVFFAFSRFDHVRDDATFVQDHALLARAAATVGDDALAWNESVSALNAQRVHPDAMRLAVASYFNLLLNGSARPGDEARWLEICRDLLATESGVPELRAVAAVGLWRAGQSETALTEWRRLATTPNAWAARVLVADPSAAREETVPLPATAWTQPLVCLAATRLGIAPPPGVVLESKERAEVIIARVLNQPPLRNP
jgi:hypothetical protein